MQEKAKEPEIRFAGFTGAWEQRKIKDLAANTYGGGTPSTSNPDFWEGSIPWIQSSDLSEHNLFRVRPRKFISQAAITNSPVKIIPESSIAVITRVGVGKLAVMNFSYTTSQDFLSLSNLNTDVKFTSYQLYRRLQKDLNAVQGTSIKGITKEELLGKNIFIPGRQEQEAIGKFFSKIDSLLTLHQRKYEKLLNIKKSMLEKMFPKEGEVVPEIRFKGFTGAWEQRKLNEIADVYDGVHQTPKYTSSGVRFLSVENIATLESEKYISEADFIRDFKIFPQKGDILMTRIGDIGTAKVIKSDEKYAFYVSLALLKPKHINSDFLCNSIASKNFQKGLKARSLLTAIPLKINKEEIGKVATSFPLNLSEQEKIGSFFNHIESLLTLHQRKLEMLKNVKQAFLEKMFV